MLDAIDQLAKPSSCTVSERLNRECFCVTLDRDALSRSLEDTVGDPSFYTRFIQARPHLLSGTAVFLSASDVRGMVRVVQAIESVARLSAYRDAVLSWAPEIARREFGPSGAFMGYDFHLTGAGPKLIEINTNAGGAFLNALSARAQLSCCGEIEVGLSRSEVNDFEPAVLGMFQREWMLQRAEGRPRRIAIVDDRPAEQYLYPEFVLARQFFLRHGIEAVIADAGSLRYEGGLLRAGDDAVDLVYNRLVDFALERPEHAGLRAAYCDGAVVVTPNPRVHALYADKRNLSLLSDRPTLRAWGLPAETIADLAGVPHTVLVTLENAERLWETRKHLFFKPAGGHGGKAVYRGDKVTRRAWTEIVGGGYVAQEYVAPTERIVEVDGFPQARKADVRLYVYDGRVLLAAARLYQGQTTNFRTPGGGFAPVFVIE